MQRELLLLREMRDAAVAIQDLVGDWSAEQVEADQLRRPALLWHFTVLGEAASQVSSETRDSHSQIAWRAATRLRNRIVHGYWDIDVETLVATAADDLPRMRATTRTTKCPRNGPKWAFSATNGSPGGRSAQRGQAQQG